MKRIIKVAGALAIIYGSLAGVQMVAAHHAMVMYDNTKTVTLDGTLLEFRWTNPHVFLRVEGKFKDRDQSEVWLLETSSRASPPLAPTAQMSPPETNAISALSGEIAGSVK